MTTSCTLPWGPAEIGALQRDPSRAAEAAPSPGKQPERAPEPRRAIRCAACGAEITSADRRIEVDGAHRHRFMNPAGFVYDIACYSEAPGCGVVGQPTAEFTWFRGFAWSYANCKGCLVHLGWAYENDEERRFFGLIENRLVETTDDPDAGAS